MFEIPLRKKLTKQNKNEKDCNREVFHTRAENHSCLETWPGPPHFLLYVVRACGWLQLPARHSKHNCSLWGGFAAWLPLPVARHLPHKLWGRCGGRVRDTGSCWATQGLDRPLPPAKGQFGFQLQGLWFSTRLKVSMTTEELHPKEGLKLTAPKRAVNES